MVRVLDDARLKFHNRREWRTVLAAAVPGPVMVPNLVDVLRAGVRRLHALESTPPAAKAAG